MAFMMPIVKNDYELYSRSPKQKIVLKNQLSKGKRQQSHSITIGVLQHEKSMQQKIIVQRRVHSKSVTDQPKQVMRSRSSSNNSNVSSNFDSLEVIRNRMCLNSREGSVERIEEEDEEQHEKIKGNQLKNSQNKKIVWYLNIFKSNKNSQSSSHKVS